MKTKLILQISLSFLVLLFAGWAFYEYQQAESEKQDKQKVESLLSQVDINNLKSFRIITKKGELLVFKHGEEWLVKKPVQDLASWQEISGWLDKLKNTVVKKITPDKEFKLKEYYLDLAPKVEIVLKSGQKISFLVSHKSSFDGKYFIKKGEELFLGEDLFYQEVNNKDFNSFRSQKILPSLGHALLIEFKGLKKDFTLTWDDYKWALKGGLKIPLSKDRLDEFWSHFNSLKAESIEPFKDLKKYHLHKPKLNIMLTYKKGQKITVKLSPVKQGKVFVWASHRDYIFSISNSSAKKLTLSLKDIRDHNFPFKYPHQDIVFIEKQTTKNSFKIQKKKDKWQAFNTDKKIDPEKLKNFLQTIKNLKGETYKTQAFKKSLRSLVLKNKKQELVFELKEVFVEDSVSGSIPGSISWVKTNLWDELVALSKSSLDDIFKADLFITPPLKEDKLKDSHKEGS